MKHAFIWLKGLSVGKKIGLGLGTLIVLSSVGGNHQTANLNVSPVGGSCKSSITGSTTKKAVKLPVITTETKTETEAVLFTSSTVQDSTLPKGTTRITTTGVNGVKTFTYKLTFSDGVQTNKELISSEVTTQPINQVTAVGTYEAAVQSCPNGSYTNSAGNTVCSPYQSNSAPAGATARCVDGSYSFSQSRSGTCSHHGGVAEWL